MQIFRSSFSKIPKHSKFDYQPRYSGAEEEEVEVEKRISFNRKGLPFSDSNLISGKLRRSVVTYRKRETQKRKMRLYILLGAVIAILILMIQNL
ncbi:MAG: hypothetical protein HKN92_02630 [Chitinophagales bacterium]|nr:hypothetical protein [Chitinophagales bacterium]